MSDVKSPTPEEIIEAIEKDFKENIKPEWDEMDKHTIRRGRGTIVFVPS